MVEHRATNDAAANDGHPGSGIHLYTSLLAALKFTRAQPAGKSKNDPFCRGLNPALSLGNLLLQPQDIDADIDLDIARLQGLCLLFLKRNSGQW